MKGSPRDFFTAMSVIWLTTWHSTRLVYRAWFRNREWLAMFFATPALLFVFVGLVFWSIYISIGFALGNDKALTIMSGRRNFLKAVQRGDYELNKNARKEATCG